MRCCRAFALEKVEKLRLRASCSAADAMYRSYGFKARCARSASGAYASTSLTQQTKKAHPAGGRMRNANQLASVWGLLPRCLDRDEIDLATGRFDSGRCTSRCVVDVERHLLGGETGRTDQAHAILGTTDDAGSDQRCSIDHCLGVELASIDIGLEAV